MEHTLDVDDQPVKPGPLDRVVSAWSIRVDHHEQVGTVILGVGIFDLGFTLHLENRLVACTINILRSSDKCK
jgi:hypothetical protein